MKGTLSKIHDNLIDQMDKLASTDVYDEEAIRAECARARAMLNLTDAISSNVRLGIEVVKLKADLKDSEARGAGDALIAHIVGDIGPKKISKDSSQPED